MDQRKSELEAISSIGARGRRLESGEGDSLEALEEKEEIPACSLSACSDW